MQKSNSFLTLIKKKVLAGKLIWLTSKSSETHGYYDQNISELFAKN